MNNPSSYCGLVDAKIRASDKDLPVKYRITTAELIADHGSLLYNFLTKRKRSKLNFLISGFSVLFQGFEAADGLR